jgi:hypothetical protein
MTGYVVIARSVSDEAIQLSGPVDLDCFPLAALGVAMTGNRR